MSERPTSSSAKELRKAKRAAKAQADDAINEELAAIEENLHHLIDTAATKLDIDAEEIRSRFLAYAGSRASARPTAWNGLIHEKSKEWSDMKGSYGGGAYMLYVLERIRDEGLYEDMSDDMKEHYIKVAQKARDNKLNAGSARTGTKRLAQGSVKEELDAIGEKLNYLHSVTQVEYMLLSVRSKATDGLQAVYYASNKARSFMESHLTIEMSQLLTLMESAALGGVQKLADRSHTETAQTKSEVRKALLKSLREAAAAIASDGSPPMATNPNAIPFVEYKNYHKTVKQYKVAVHNWPMKTLGQMMDPNTMGLGQLQLLLRRIRGEDCGFKRLTEAEWNEWNEKFESEIKSGAVEVSLRKTRSDAGKKRKVGQQSVESGGSNDQNQQRSQTSIALESEIEPQVAPGAAGAPTVEYSNAVHAPSPSALFEPPFQATQPAHPFDSPLAEAFSAPGPATWPSLDAPIGLQGGFSGLEGGNAIQPPPFAPHIPSIPQSPSLRFQDAETPETLARRTASPRRLRSRTPANPPAPHQQPVRTLRNRTITRSMSSAVATSTVPAPLTVSQLEGFYSEFAPPGV